MRASSLAFAMVLWAPSLFAQTPSTTPSSTHSVSEDALTQDELRALLRASTLRMLREGEVGGLAALAAEDGLMVTSAHVAGDVGSGCRARIEARDGARWDAELLTLEVVGDTAVFRVRDFAGVRVGLRVATEGPAVGASVYALSDDGDGPLVVGRVEAHPHGELRVALSAPVSPRAWGGPVVNADGQLLGALSPMPGSPTHGVVSPLTVLRRVLPSLHREISTPLCVPPYGASLGPAWHLGFELAAAIPTRGDARSVYPTRLTAMFFERWYFRMTAGVSWSDTTSVSGSMAGGPVLFRTVGDGVVAIGARAEGDFGPLNADLTVRREFYGFEVHATGYLSSALGLTVNVGFGADRRWRLGQSTADYGAALVFSVGLTARTRHN